MIEITSSSLSISLFLPPSWMLKIRRDERATFIVVAVVVFVKSRNKMGNVFSHCVNDCATRARSNGPFHLAFRCDCEITTLPPLWSLSITIWPPHDFELTRCFEKFSLFRDGYLRLNNWLVKDTIERGVGGIGGFTDIPRFECKRIEVQNLIVSVGIRPYEN